MPDLLADFVSVCCCIHFAVEVGEGFRLSSLCHQIFNTFSKVVQTWMHISHPFIEDRIRNKCGLCVMQSFLEVRRPHPGAHTYFCWFWRQNAYLSLFKLNVCQDTICKLWPIPLSKKCEKLTLLVDFAWAGMSPCNKWVATLRWFTAQTLCTLSRRFLSSWKTMIMSFYRLCWRSWEEHAVAEQCAFCLVASPRWACLTADTVEALLFFRSSLQCLVTKS